MGTIHEQLMNTCGQNARVRDDFYIPTTTPKLLCEFSPAIEVKKTLNLFGFIAFSTYTQC